MAASEWWDSERLLFSIITSVVWITLKIQCRGGSMPLTLVFKRLQVVSNPALMLHVPSSRVKSPLPTPGCSLRICSFCSGARASTQRLPSPCFYGQELSFPVSHCLFKSQSPASRSHQGFQEQNSLGIRKENLGRWEEIWQAMLVEKQTPTCWGVHLQVSAKMLVPGSRHNPSRLIPRQDQKLPDHLLGNAQIRDENPVNLSVFLHFCHL